MAAAEHAAKEEIPNLRFMKCAAEYLPRFIPAGSAAEIYLNFSCPFPKAKYAKHRLTHPRFLEIYKKLMAPGAVICQKTDNPRFFEFSIENFSAAGFVLSNVSLDLHNSTFEGNIVTEYENRFASQGLPIYRPGGKACGVVFSNHKTVACLLQQEAACRRQAGGIVWKDHLKRHDFESEDIHAKNFKTADRSGVSAVSSDSGIYTVFRGRGNVYMRQMPLAEYMTYA